MKKKLLGILGSLMLILTLSSCTPKVVSSLIGEGAALVVDKRNSEAYFEIHVNRFKRGTYIIPRYCASVYFWRYGNCVKIEHFRFRINYTEEYALKVGYYGLLYNLYDSVYLDDYMVSITVSGVYGEYTDSVTVDIS